MDRDGGNQRRLTRNSGRDGDPSWSPDSMQIVFESKRYDRVDIYRMNTDGEETGVIRLTSEGNFNSTPAWSPDGRWIGYERQDTWRNYDLWIMDPNGNSKRSLTTGGENFRPAWSGDSQHLAFTSKRGGDYASWVINIVSGVTFQLSKAGGFDAAWSIR